MQIEAIQWDDIKSRHTHPDKCWTTPDGQEAQLETVTLVNGLRYALARDRLSGEETFNVCEVGGSVTTNDGMFHESFETQRPDAIIDTDLGDGYRLVNMFAETGFPSQRHTITYVEKEVDVPYQPTVRPSTHRLSFNIDPHFRSFESRHDYCDGIENSRLYIHDPNKPVNKGAFATLIVGEMSTDDVAEFNFAADGALRSVKLVGKSILGKAGVSGSEKGHATIIDSELETPQSRQLISKILGVDSNQPLKLDLEASVNNMLSNIDSPNPISPRLALKYKETPNTITPSASLLK